MSDNISEAEFKNLIKTATSKSHYFKTGECGDDGLWHYGMLARVITFNENLTADYVHDYEYDTADPKGSLNVTMSGDDQWDFNFGVYDVIDASGKSLEPWQLINIITEVRPEFLDPDMSTFNKLGNQTNS